MSERLRTKTPAVVRDDRWVLRRNRHPLGTRGEKRKSTASRLKLRKKFRNPYGSNPPFDPQAVLPSDPQDLVNKKIFHPM